MVEDAQAIRHGANGTDLSDLFRRSKSLVENARSYVGTLINAVTVYTSFELGRYIVEEEQGGYERAGYGKHVIDALSEYLTAEFGRGFSRANVAKMRQFYLEYRDRQASIVSTGLRRLTTLDAEGIVSTPSRQFVGQPQTMPFRLCKRSDQALVELTLPKDAHIRYTWARRTGLGTSTFATRTWTRSTSGSRAACPSRPCARATSSSLR